jgi:uncharacterized SAM-binding protein YcdF (DUF218 family)
MARGIALFFGAFTLLNLAGTDANLWWIDLAPLYGLTAEIVLATFAVTLLAYAFKPRLSRARRVVDLVLIAIVLAAAIANAVRYYSILARGDVRSPLPVPLALLIAAAMVVLFVAHLRPPSTSWRAFALAFIACGVLFPLAQIALFGVTDYRRRADVIVVFGARVLADGSLSDALRDRVQTACELYREGLAPRLFFSGGPGEGALDEANAMRAYAYAHRVPQSAIVVDSGGINTESTVRNTIAAFGTPRILAVSHFYHLPRIKMTYQRYGAAHVFTVPSHNEAGGMLFNLTREDAAFWSYYVRRFTMRPQSVER